MLSAGLSPNNQSPVSSTLFRRLIRRSKLRLIKRLKSVEETGLWLLGDNPTESTDSRQLGAVPTNLLIGEVVGRLPLGESEQRR